MGDPRLLHGFMGSSGSWGPEITSGLAAAGFVPIALDLPGHGHRRGEADPGRFALDAVLSEIDASAADGPVVGYSMGGRIALHLAFRYPSRVSGLVLESASPGLATEEERVHRRAADEALAARLESDGVTAFVDRWERMPLFATQAALPGDARASVLSGRLANRAAPLAASLRALGTGALPSLWDELGRVRMPVLLLAGSLDHKFVSIAERMAELLPNARLEIVSGAGHAVHLERPDAWLESVVGFLAGAR